MMIIPFVVSIGMLVPKVMGYTEYTVVTASMEPVLPVGSLILVKQTDPATLEKGDMSALSAGLSKSDKAKLREILGNKELMTKLKGASSPQEVMKILGQK